MNKLVKINRADLKLISNIIIFKRAELEHSLKNLNKHEPISNNLKNKRTIRKQRQTRLGSDRLQPYQSPYPLKKFQRRLKKQQKIAPSEPITMKNA